VPHRAVQASIIQGVDAAFARSFSQRLIVDQTVPLLPPPVMIAAWTGGDGDA
jgi:hypothetical protein